MIDGSVVSVYVHGDREDDGDEAVTVMADGGAVAEPDDPPLPRVIADVLDDASGGLDRQVLVERVAEVSGATLEEVEEVLGGEIRYGRVDVADGKLRKASNRRFLGRGRR